MPVWNAVLLNLPLLADAHVSHLSPLDDKLQLVVFWSNILLDVSSARQLSYTVCQTGVRYSQLYCETSIDAQLLITLHQAFEERARVKSRSGDMCATMQQKCDTQTATWI